MTEKIFFAHKINVFCRNGKVHIEKNASPLHKYFPARTKKELREPIATSWGGKAAKKAGGTIRPAGPISVQKRSILFAQVSYLTWPSKYILFFGS